MVSEKKTILSVGLSSSKSDELIAKFTNSDYSLEQIKDIEKLVNEFSNFARLPKANNKKIHLSEILSIYIDEYKRNYPNIKINFNIEKNLFINFDHSYLDIIFNNLFKNSIEALEKTHKPAIDISLKKTDKKLILTFFDIKLLFFLYSS